MSIESKITAHYGGKSVDDLRNGNHHMHIGGQSATEFILGKLNLTPLMRLIDIGCGVGGPSLFAAQTYGCQISGIDLTPDFIESAKALAGEKNLSEKTYFQCASADDIPFDDGSFDAAMMIHVGMNIAHKKPVYQEIFRVLKPKSTFLIYDILAMSNVADMIYPCPWAKTDDTSFLEPIETVQTFLDATGFEIVSAENSQDYALSALTKMLADNYWAGREDYHQAIMNLHQNVQNNACAPFIIMARKS